MVGDMRHMTILECSVPMGNMKEFVAEIQRAEDDARASGSGPEFHGMYVLDADPSRVLVLSQFSSRAAAVDFSTTGLPEQFRARVAPFTDEPPLEAKGFDLYYATLPDGDRVVFGQSG